MSTTLLNKKINDFYSKILKRLRILISLYKNKSKLSKTSGLSRDTIYRLSDTHYLRRKNFPNIEMITILKLLYGINISPYCFFNFTISDKEFLKRYKNNECGTSKKPSIEYKIFQNNLLNFKRGLKKELSKSKLRFTDNIILDEFTLIFEDYDVNNNFLKNFQKSNSSTLDTVFKFVCSLKIPTDKIFIFFMPNFTFSSESKDLANIISNFWKKNSI